MTLSTESNSTRHGPLAGLRVLEFGQIAAGPFAGSLLADLGADVVKVENPVGGDGMRGWPPLTEGKAGASYSENFASINRNKRSITIDLKDPDSRARLKALIGTADVLVENFRTGTLDRFELGYDDVKTQNPKLVYCSITGYGHRGPHAKRGAFDVTVQAMSGLMSVTGEEGRPPVKCGVPVGDFCAGLYAAYAIVTAVMQARETGKGAFIDCPMLGALIGVAALQTSEYFGTGRSGRRIGSAHPRNAPYQAFRASDNYFVIAAGNDNLWREVAEAIARPDLVEDTRFRTQPDRARNQEELAGILAEPFAKHTVADWIAEMDRRGVPCSPINGYADILNDPQVEAMGLVVPLDLPNGVTTRTTAFPAQISGYDSPFGVPRLSWAPIPQMCLPNGSTTQAPMQKLDTDGPQGKQTLMGPLIVERRDAVAILTLNRPDRLNALNTALVEALIESIYTAVDSGARLIVFRGAGKGFSAGFDVDGLDGMTDGDLVLRFLRLEQFLQSVRHAPVATLALAHGACFGAAADLVAACRWRVAAPGTRFRMPGLRFGVVLGTRRLSHVVGTDTARDLLETSKVFEHEEALATGFLNGVVAQEAWPDIVEANLKTATALATESQTALLACTVPDTRDTDLAALARSVAQPGLKERMSAYVAGLQRKRS